MQKNGLEIPYSPILKMPVLNAEDLSALRSNIAQNGVVVPIILDEQQNIIDGFHRLQIATELGYECPEVVIPNLSLEEKRTLARSLNLARRQLSSEQRRALIADQLAETPGLSNRLISKQLGVSHPTVASVRAELTSTGKLFQLDRTKGIDGKVRSIRRTTKIDREISGEVRLIHGDCLTELRGIPDQSVDVVLCDPPYPCIEREYGKLTEDEWQVFMEGLVRECRRVLKSSGSAVFILQPNSESVGKMRLWVWEFLIWAAKEWNLIQDFYAWTKNCLPTGGGLPEYGLMRQSVKICVWLGNPDCYRNQDRVIVKYSDTLLNQMPDSHTASNKRRNNKARIIQKTIERGGSTPFNCLPITVGHNPTGHPAVSPHQLTEWWSRYLTPPQGVLLDPCCGGGTSLLSGLVAGAGMVIGIDKEHRYLTSAAQHLGVPIESIIQQRTAISATKQ